MTDSDKCELSLNELKDFNGGSWEGKGCNDTIGQAKMMKKIKKKGAEWCKEPEKQSGIETQDNN